ncbi:hypothetical protein LTR94_024721, partial [Friedmanniomyces endolithicus]
DQLTGGSGQDSYVLVDNGGGGGPVGVASIEGVAAFSASFTAQDLADVDVITDFEAGADGDVLDVPYSGGEVGISYPVYVQRDGADTIVFIDREDGNGIVPAVRLVGIDPADLTRANFNGAPFQSLDPLNLTGTEGVDVLYGGGGDDVINGGYGADTLYGQNGDDTLIGDNGTPNPSPIDLAAYFGPLSNALVSGLGGDAGFGEAAFPASAPYQSVDVDIPSDFNGGSLMIGGEAVSQIHIDSYGPLSIGSLGLQIWPYYAVDTSGGPLTPTPGGNSQGSNRIWYDFDATTNTITVTWDDVGSYYGHSTPSAFQAQIKVLGDDDFDVIYRYEDLNWPGGIYSPPALSINGLSVSLPIDPSLATQLDNLNGNAGAPGVWAAQIRNGSIIGVSQSEADILWGGAGDDILQGGLGNDTLDGGDGDDTLVGGVGDDVLRDSVGANSFDGGAGNDTLSGFSGNGYVDRLKGGDGQDTFIVNDNYYAPDGSGGRAVDVIEDFTAGAGGDKLQINYAFGGLAYARDGADTLIYADYNDGKGKVPILRLQGVDPDTLVDANFSGQTLYRLDPMIVSGTAGDDIIQGGYANDELSGGPGADTIHGYKGDDHLVGDDGSAGEASPDLAAYFGPIDRSLINTLGGARGFGDVALGRADDTGTSIALPSTFHGGSVVVGGAAVTSVGIDNNGYVEIGGLHLGIYRHDADTRAGELNPSPGGNSAGSNEVWYDFDDATNTITITWDDIGRFSSGTAPNAFQLQVHILGDDQFDIVYRYEQLVWSGAYPDQVPSIVIGGQRFDIPAPNNDPTLLDSEAGNIGSSGVWVAQVRGGAITGGPLAIDDRLYGEEGNDLLDGGSGNDILDGGVGNDTLRGGAGHDQLTGGAGADILDGGAGNDRFFGVADDASVDQFTGGLGRDEYSGINLATIGTIAVEDVITDFEAGASGDIIHIAGVAAGSNPFTDNVLFVRRSGNDTVLVYRGADGHEQSIVRLQGVDPASLVPANFDGYIFPQ